MTQSHSTSLGKQIRVVLLSYLTRTGFRWGFVGMVSAIALHFLTVGLGMLFPGNRYLELSSFLDLISDFASLLLVGSVVGLFIIFLWHARQQLMGPLARLMPNARSANVFVAGMLLIAFALLIACQSFKSPHQQFFGVFIIALMILTLIAGAFCNPWLAPVPIVLGLLASRNIYVYAYVYEAVEWVTGKFDVTGRTPPNKLWARLWEAHSREIFYVRALVAMGDILALILLEKLARPRKYAFRFPTIILGRKSEARPVFDRARHQLVDSAFARSLHRRFAVHDWRAAGVAALGIAVIAVWTCLQFRSNAASVLSMLVALLPGALVAMGWRDRWGILDFESLYPVSRRQFFSDMAVGLLLDAAEFWIASAVAALVVCLCTRLPSLRDIHFWAALLVGAMMQIVWISGVFFIGQRRQTLSYVAGLAPFAVVIFATLESIWRQSHPLSAILSVAVLETLAGIAIFAMTWAYLQRTPRVNGSRILDVAQPV